MAKPATNIVAKIIGSDEEFGNFILGDTDDDGWTTGAQAAQRLLAEINGVNSNQSQNGWNPYPSVPHMGYPYSYANAYSPQIPETSTHNPQDWGRKFTGNGSCFYIDLCHLEACSPEVSGAAEFVARSKATRRFLGKVLNRANEKMPDGQKIILLANNCDGHGNSWGSHFNVLLSREAYDSIFVRLYPALFYLAAFQISSIVITGQGKVGSENGMPPVDFQLSQRADFLETLFAQQTTYNRPIVNSRDEALCGHSGSSLARLHCIFFDHSLCDTTSYLKAGLMQIVLAMIEAGNIDRNLMLEDPLSALGVWSRDPGLRSSATLVSGKRVTAVELQLLFLEEARQFIQRGECIDAVPDAAVILDLWSDTLEKLCARDFDALGRRLDWVLKHTLLNSALDKNPQLNWSSPEIKHIDLVYASLDDDGLYNACVRSGVVESVVDELSVEHCHANPPADTRAYTRAQLLSRWGDDVVTVDWDKVGFARGEIALPDPRSHTKQDMEAVLNSHSLAGLLKSIGTLKPTHQFRSAHYA